MTEELLAELNTTCALTDLAAGLILLPMIGVIACRKTEHRSEKRLWLLFFSCLAASCLLGFFTHNYCTGTLFRRMWIPLYAAMLESVTAFFLLALHSLRGKAPGKRAVLILHGVALAAYLPIMICESFLFMDMIRPFVIVAAVFGLSAFGIMIRCAARQGSIPERVVASAVLPLLVAVYFQIRREGMIRIIWAFDCNGIAHLFIILSFFLLFTASLLALKREK